MSKYYGHIGFVSQIKDDYGVVTEQPIERQYCGDLIWTSSKLDSTNRVNDDVDISNKISIIADSYARENFADMRYVWFMGSRWKVKSIEVRAPRLIISIGGVYNGPYPY